MEISFQFQWGRGFESAETDHRRAAGMGRHVSVDEAYVVRRSTSSTTTRDRRLYKVLMLRAELERTTSKPRESTLEDRRHLVDKGVGIDPDTCRRISVFDPAEIKNPIRQKIVSAR